MAHRVNPYVWCGWENCFRFLKWPTLEFLFRHNSSVSMTAATIQATSPPLYTPLIPYTRSWSFFWIPLQLTVSLKMIDTCRSSLWWKHLHEFSTGKYWQLSILARSGAISVPVYSAPAKQSNPAATVKMIAETICRFKWKGLGDAKQVQTQSTNPLLNEIFVLVISDSQLLLVTAYFPGYGDSGSDLRPSKYSTSPNVRQKALKLFCKERFQSCGQHPSRFIEKKGSVHLRKDINFHRTGLAH